MNPAFEHLLRDATPRVLGALIRRYRDFAAAEDALQEALLAAAAQWPREGLPANPPAWLYHVAARRLTDQIRADSARRRRETEAAAMSDGYAMPAAEAHDDDSLVLLHMCCHPALTTPSAIALTLRAVGGLTTAEIARAFLVPEATMAQRISRAKQTIRDSGIPFCPPEPADRDRSLATVLHVLYLIFNEGYTASSGDQLQRIDLSAEAIRLTRMLYAQLPAEPEVIGLLALMLLTDARRDARSGRDGEAIPLDEQDRSLWNNTLIVEGLALLAIALPMGRVGPYQLQAAIAAVHDEAATADATDWRQIVQLYHLLLRISDNPMVALNHAVAVAMVEGPRRGLELIDALKGIEGHYRVDAARARLLELDGRPDEAIALYRAAAAKTVSLPERNYLLLRAARLS